MKNRLKKKIKTLGDREATFMEWLMDFHSCLIDGLTDPEPQLELIVKQFKNKVLRGGRHSRYRSVKITRLREYVALCMGPLYGRECKR